MTVSDKALFPMGPFPAGVNNVAPGTKPPTDQDGNVLALREGVNIDFDATGRPRRRRGYGYEVSGEAHSLFSTGEHLFANVAGVLGAYDGDPLVLVQAIRTVGERFVSITSDDFDVFWSNGVEIGRIDADLADLPIWIGTPDPCVVAATAAGGLAAGSYEVSVTVTDASGRESGASNPVVLTMTAGQGIAVTLPAAPVTAVAWHVYVSPPNGDVLYHVANLPIAATSVNVGVHTPGKALETAWLFPMLPCTVLRYGHGRLMGLTADAMIWSESYRLGLMHDQNALGLNGPTLLEPVGEGGDGAGWYVADRKRTYFLAGSDPHKAQQVIRYGHSAVPGSSMIVPGNVFGLETTAPVAFWLATNGVFLIGLPGGVIQPVREGQLALPQDSERGAVGYFEFDGIRQMVASIVAGTANPLAVGMSDSADATVRRNGITL